VHEPADVAVAVKFRDRDGRVQIRFQRAEGGWAWVLLFVFFLAGLFALLWDESRRDRLKALVWGWIQVDGPRIPASSRPAVVWA
jgi:hypothetical protein